MGIAMDNSQVASQMVAREQIWRAIQQPCVKTLPVGSYHLTIPVREPRELNSEVAQNPVPGRRIVPSPDRDTEPSIIPPRGMDTRERDRKSTRLNSSHTVISYAVFCLKKKKQKNYTMVVDGEAPTVVAKLAAW